MDSGAMIGSLALEVLRRALGGDAQRKSLQCIVALPQREGGVEHQQWHRDTPLLFPDFGTTDEPPPSGGDDGAWGGGGPMLPPYAVNVFIPLVNITSAMGPTEFTLGSHAWGSVPPTGSALTGKPTGQEKDLAFAVPAGTVILADYRTVHRGTRNRSDSQRPVAMFIFGRSWWRDAVNYDEGDFGGSAVLSSKPSGKTKQETMFWSLVNKWQAGIGSELQRRWEARTGRGAAREL